MRLSMVVAAALAATSIAAPAEAAIFTVQVSGHVTGLRFGFGCPFGDSACEVSPWAGNVRSPTVILDLQEGDNPFTMGNSLSVGLFSGTIVNSGGYLTGRDLSYGYESCSSPDAGCYAVSGSAATFYVSGGVPEPTTWALMLLGFSLVGAEMHRARQAKRSLVSA